MDADERAAALSLIGIMIGSVLVAVGIAAGAHVVTLLGLIAFPSAIMYGLLGGYSSSESSTP